jgi:hypothetical protein
MILPAGDTGAIAQGMLKQLRDQDRIKADLYMWQQSDAAQQFMKDVIAQQFRSGLQVALQATENQTGARH